MLKSEAELIIDNIPYTGKQIFVYKQEFVPDHYIELTRSMDNQYTITQKTINEIPNFVDKVTGFVVKEELVKLLTSEQLKPHTGGWYMDFSSFRTKGCDCGAWVTSNPDNHSTICRKYFKYG